MAKKVDLSIIVLNYNTRDLLKNCLNKLEKAEEDGYSYETIVVDNASTDGSPKMVRDNFPWAELIVSKKNLGFAGGNNLGLKKARGKYILFLNSDTEIRADAFKKMISFMETNPKIGAATPKTMLVSGGMDPDCHRGFPTPWASFTYFLGLEKLFPKSKIFGQYHKFYFNLDRAHEIDAGFGTFMIVRRKALKEVGDWDEKYFFYGEDLDLFYRIKKAGWKVMFYPEVLLKHHKGASSGLRPESRGVTKASREIRVKVARSSTQAMEVFYRKFYKGKYPFWITWLVISGIRLMGFFRILRHRFR